MTSSAIRRPFALDLLKLFAGTVLQTAPYAFVMVPARIVNGGLTSFALVLHGLTGVPVAFLANGILVVLMVVVWWGLGHEWLLKSIISSVFYAATLTLFLGTGWSWGVSPWLSIPVSALSVGAGYFLCIHARGTSMGFDVIALILHRRIPRIRVAPAMRVINVLVILSGYAVFGPVSVLVGIAFTVIQTWVLGMLMKPRVS